MTKAIIETYGCTLNRADSDIMASLLASQGIDVNQGRYAPGGDDDYVIINTCTVKTPTERRIIDRIRKISSEGKSLIVTGCMASANPDKIKKVAPNARIVTTSNVHRITEAIHGGSVEAYSRIDKLEYHKPSGTVISRIPISEGCLSSCGFCETKFARGPLNSFSEKLILRAIEMNVQNGAREIELTSQDVGAYGLDRGTNIAQLLLGVKDIEGDFRIRVGMLNPEHLEKYIDPLIDAYGDGRIYRFIHLPLQSASNSVLKSMDRRYTIERFCSHIKELRNKVKDISIETDMIVGYPTETDDDFEESMRFIRDSRPTFTNVSRFGARPHARASKLKQLGNLQIKQRSTGMSRLARAVQKEDFSKLVGKRERILITESNERSYLGRDDSYRIVALGRSDADLVAGQFVEAEINDNTSVCLLGSISPK